MRGTLLHHKGGEMKERYEWTLGNCGGQGPWHATVHGVTKSYIQLSDWTTTRLKIHFWVSYRLSQHLQTHSSRWNSHTCLSASWSFEVLDRLQLQGWYNDHWRRCSLHFRCSRAGVIWKEKLGVSSLEVALGSLFSGTGQLQASEAV